MADYHPLIARAIAGLENNTGEARRVVYERARAALVAQLRGVSPALSESDITRERLALEEAIRKTEADHARKGRLDRPAANKAAAMAPSRAASGAPAPQPEQSDNGERASQPGEATAPADRAEAEPAASSQSPSDHSLSSRAEGGNGSSEASTRQPPQPVTPSAADLGEPEQGEVEAQSPVRGGPQEAPGEPPARGGEPASLEPGWPRLPREPGFSLTDQGLKGYRDLSGKSDRPDDPLVRGNGGQGPQDKARLRRELDILAEQFARAPRRESQPGPGEPTQESYSVHPERSLGSVRPERDVAPPLDRDSVQEQPLPPPLRRRSGVVLKVILAVLLLAMLGALGAVGYREQGRLAALYDSFRGPPAKVVQGPSQAPPKIEDRIGSGQSERPLTANRQNQPATVTQPPPAVAQRVVLYEEDPKDPQGKRYVGSVVWRTETVSPGRGLAPELAVKATIEVPERSMTMTFSMVRNTDPALPASHTVDIRFKLPPNFSSGGVASVPGILMKQTEQARGVPLAGLAVKVTDNVFLIGLSAVPADVERNTQLLKERPWFDIPIVYSNGSRAILAMEKGNPGERAFNEAFTAWGNAGTAAR